jgi:RNA polymerase sigma factor (sigma-70 family)
MLPPTVFIVDDDQAVRDSLQFLLESEDLRVETFESAELFLERYSIYQVGCLLLDIRMPGMSGLELQKELSKNNFALPIIIISGHGDIPVTVRAMRRGAMDFIEKPFNNDELLTRVKDALERDIDNQQKRMQNDAIRARLENLTPRERQVMKLVVKDNPNKFIASELGVTIKTIEFHRARVMEKMHADSLLHLVEMVNKAKPS